MKRNLLRRNAVKDIFKILNCTLEIIFIKLQSSLLYDTELAPLRLYAPSCIFGCRNRTRRLSSFLLFALHELHMHMHEYIAFDLAQLLQQEDHS